MIRPLTEEERATLAVQATFSPPFGGFLAPAMGRALLTLLAGFLLLGVPLALARVDFTAWPAKDLLALGVVGVFAFWTGIALRDWRRRRRELAPRQAALRADLEGGVAHTEPYRAIEVIRATARVNGERCYFVRLDDGRVMLVGYWNPPDDAEAEGPEVGGFPAAEFEVARGPRSRIALGVAGRGEFLAPSRAIRLAPRVVDEGLLPESGTVIETPWEAIAVNYGATDPDESSRRRP